MCVVFISAYCCFCILYLYTFQIKYLLGEKLTNSTRVNFSARHQTVVTVVLPFQFYRFTTLWYRLVLNFGARVHNNNALPD